MKKVINSIQNSGEGKLVLFLFLIQILIHIKYSNYPPVGFHLWRQTMGLSVARNFYEEDMNIFKPRVDSRGEHTGITGMEFPIVNYVIALTYKVFGLNNITPRYTILFFSFLAILFSFLFFKEIFQNKFYAFISSFMLIFSPLFCYYSFVVMPEVPALAFQFASLFYVIKWYKDNKKIYFVVSCLFLMLSALIKISFLVSTPFFIYLMLKRKDFKFFIIFSISLLIVLAWYIYAWYLSLTYQNFDFRLSPNLPDSWNSVVMSTKRVFIQWLPELYINYAEFLLFVLGVLAIKREIDLLKDFLKTYMVGLVIFMVLFYPALYWHDYYMILSLPVLIGISTSGFKYLFEISQRNRYFDYLIILILIAIPILGTIRGLSRLENGLKSMKIELLTLERGILQIVPDNELVIVCCDESPSIYLYFAHRKGWSITQDIDSSRFIDMIKKGARYLISDSRKFEEREDIKRYLIFISQYGSFKIFKIVQD